MSLINACSWQRPQPVARGALRTVADHGYVPAAGLEFDNVGDEVSLLQWDLAYLGFIDADEVSAGGGRFGPLTESAVTAFQDAKGLPTTGFYGDLTAAALVQALLAAPADVPVQDLEREAESDAVARLQAALQELGYMDLVTGYYGEITTDAVTGFQQDNGIEATGAYGAITRMALATRLRAPVAQAPVVEQAAVIEEVELRLGFTAFELMPY
jgi:peptidoglycan hydrolase-like protein with peptidoglycan-binding domain